MSARQSSRHTLEQARAKSKRQAWLTPLLMVSFLLLGGGLAVFLSQSFNSEKITEVTPSPPATKVQDDVTQADVSRQDIQSALSQLKSRVTEHADNTAKFNWQSTRSAGYVAAMDQLFLTYAAGNYGQVSQDITALNQQLDQYDSQYTQAYQQLHGQAQQHFDDEKIPQATLANQQTLAINPSYQPAVGLKQRIAVFGTVQRLLRDIVRAEAERNIDDQYALLTRLVALDTYRETEKSKLAAVASLIKDRAFADAVKNAYQSLQRQNLTAANKHLRNAEAIDSTRSELQALAQALSKAKENAALDALHRQIQSLKTADNWPEIAQLATSAVAKFPNDARLQDTLKTAGEIAQARAYMTVYLQAPERVFDNNIRAVALEDLGASAHLKGMSAGLDGMFAQVQTLLDAANTQLAVRFNSDNRTDIKVIKVGQVGKTKGRDVMLLPGTYQIEGSRRGYRDKLLTLVVRPGQANQITVICDQKIP